VQGAVGLQAASGLGLWWRERRRFWAGVFAPMRAFK